MSELDIGCESEASLLIPKLRPTDANVDLSNGGLQPVRSHDAETLRRLFASVALFITAIAMTVPTRPKLILAAAGGAVSTASYFTGLVDGTQAVLSTTSSHC
jgi:hypothetical protein